MIHLAEAIFERLRPSAASFWRWDDGAQSIAWPDGTTITFRQELALFLDVIWQRSNPSLDAVLLLLAASRKSWAAGSGRQVLTTLARTLEARDADEKERVHLVVHRILSRSGWRDHRLSPQVDIHALLRDVLDGLDQLHRALSGSSQDWRLVVTAAQLTFETFFPFAPTDLPGEAVRGLRLGFTPDQAAKLKPRPASPQIDRLRFVDMLATLHVGLRAFLGSDLWLRHRTGLDRIPRPAKVEIDDSPRGRTRALLDLLRDDTSVEISSLAALCRSVMAATHIPRALAATDEMPTGGFSDISSRGTPDHLLPIELAHDDLTLALRIITNEALYFRREMSSRTSGNYRLILLDTSIRLWGISRVFATAVGLAFAATSDPGVDVEFYRHRSGGMEVADLTTRSGLVEQLGVLNTDRHPASSLEAFARACSEKPPTIEAILITQETVLQDEDFRRQLETTTSRSGLCPLPLHVATVSTDGQYRLRMVSGRGSKLLTQARLNLDSCHGTASDCT